MIVDAIISLVIGLILIQGGIYMLKNLTKKQRYHLGLLFSFSYILIILFCGISFVIEKDEDKKKLSFFQYINNGPITENFGKTVLVGLGSGITFGIIDNAGLWFGMDALDPILPKGELTKAGFGNVYSDTLSAFLATFAGKIISNLTNTKDTPLWADALGTSCGCLFGLFGCRFITGKK